MSAIWQFFSTLGSNFVNLLIGIAQFYTDPNNNFWGTSLAFIQLCLISILIALAIGIILGIAVARTPILAFIAVNLSGLMRAIPIIAFLIAASAIPALGLGFRTAVIAMIIMGIPPVLLNTYTGLRDIDPAIVDAARGIGMTNSQIMARVQLPLVLPLIAAGARTAAVQIVATAPLAAFINAGGYGNYIVTGFYLLHNTEMLAGVIPVALIALLIEAGTSWLERALTPTGLRIKGMLETDGV